MNAKSIFVSKTFWANVLMLALSVLDNAYFGNMVSAELKGIIITVVNIALRFLAVQPVTVSGAKG